MSFQAFAPRRAAPSMRICVALAALASILDMSLLTAADVGVVKKRFIHFMQSKLDVHVALPPTIAWYEQQQVAQGRPVKIHDMCDVSFDQFREALANAEYFKAPNASWTSWLLENKVNIPHFKTVKHGPVGGVANSKAKVTYINPSPTPDPTNTPKTQLAHGLGRQCYRALSLLEADMKAIGTYSWQTDWMDEDAPQNDWMDEDAPPLPPTPGAAPAAPTVSPDEPPPPFPSILLPGQVQQMLNAAAVKLGHRAAPPNVTTVVLNGAVWLRLVNPTVSDANAASATLLTRANTLRFVHPFNRSSLTTCHPPLTSTTHHPSQVRDGRDWLRRERAGKVDQHATRDFREGHRSRAA